jgi:hypothetical protein
VTLLSEQIRKYKLPMWPYQPAYDRIVVYMLPEDMATRDTYAKGGVVVKPDAVKSQQKTVTPRGIIVAAGLGAMDHLRSNCIDLGHIVWVARFSPWRHVVERTTEGDIEFMFLRSGDIVGSETLLDLIREGKVDAVVGEDGRHQYKTEEQVVPRFDPPGFADT